MNETTGGCRRWSLARPRRVGVLAVTAGLALLTAACGSSPSSSGGASSTGSKGGATAYAAHQLAFARCVRAHGVPNFPDPQGSGQFSKQALRQLGVSIPRLHAAEAPCLNLLPVGQAPITAQDRQDYLKAAACMRSHGITNFPDPTFPGGRVNFPIPSSIDVNSQQFTQARQTCQKFIPAGLPYSGSGG